MTRTVTIPTPGHQALLPVTTEVERGLAEFGMRDGLLHLLALHTTCALLITENADPDVPGDLSRRLKGLIPGHDPADRHGEGNSAAHLASALIGPDLIDTALGLRIDPFRPAGHGIH